MRKEFTITVRQGSSRGDFAPRKWDIVKINSSGREAIVINEAVKNETMANIRLYPYKRKKTKLGKWVWFKWLKLRIWLKIIKVK